METLQDNGDCYHRLEWLHVLESKADLRDAELALLEDYDLDPPGQFPCVQVINLAFRSATRSSLGSPEDLSIAPSGMSCSRWHGSLGRTSCLWATS